MTTESGEQKKMHQLQWCILMYLLALSELWLENIIIATNDHRIWWAKENASITVIKYKRAQAKAIIHREMYSIMNNNIFHYIQ